jgi:hypothetical protein
MPTLRGDLYSVFGWYGSVRLSLQTNYEKYLRDKCIRSPTELGSCGLNAPYRKRKHAKVTQQSGQTGFLNSQHTLFRWNGETTVVEIDSDSLVPTEIPHGCV